MGGEIAIKKGKATGDWEVDVAKLPRGALASHNDVFKPIKTNYSPTADGFAPVERLEGKYSATAWVRRHWGTCERYARWRFHRHEWEGRLLELQNHPTKLRHLVLDFREHPAKKRARVIKHIATEESLITSVSGGRGKGKATALDTPIPTIEGWKAMGELRVGDHVFGLDGKPAAVTKTSEVMTGHPCYRVRFDDESTIVADAEHLWVVSIHVGNERAALLSTTAQLAQLAAEYGGECDIRVPKPRELEASPTRLAKLDLLQPGRAPEDIVSIEAAPSVPVRCIAVDNPQRMFLAGRSFVPTHNSVTTADLLYAVHKQYGRNICMLDTRPKNVLPSFVRRVVDLRAVEQEEIVWIDEGADMFSHRASTKKASIGLPAVLARARHMGLTVVALTPTTGIMDKVFDVLSDAILLKPGTMNQGTYGRSGESRIISQFPEMLPTQKMESVFVSNLIPPTSFSLPYRCGDATPWHEHEWTCCIPKFWRKDMSRSQLGGSVEIEDSPDHQELAIELLYWDNRLDQIAEIMNKRGCAMDPESWAAWLYDATKGLHPRTGRPIARFRAEEGRVVKPEAAVERYNHMRDEDAVEQQEELDQIHRRRGSA